MLKRCFRPISSLFLFRRRLTQYSEIPLFLDHRSLLIDQFGAYLDLSFS